MAIGRDAVAGGADAAALGYFSQATGEGSTALGYLAKASGQSSFATAQGSASGNYATAIRGQASGENSLSLAGTASGNQSMALRGIASGNYATTLGGGTASGAYSIAMRGLASGERSITIGDRASANGKMAAVVIAAGTGGFVTPLVDEQFVARASRFWFGSSLDVTATTGRFIETSTGAYLSTGGTWTNTSDSTKKSNFRVVDGEQVLNKLASLPVYTWHYAAEDSTVRHMGPTAQAFRKAFGLGDSETAIGTVDIDGVAMAGVKALEARTKQLKAETQALRAENAQLAERLAQLESLMARLTQTSKER